MRALLSESEKKMDENLNKNGEIKASVYAGAFLATLLGFGSSKEMQEKWLKDAILQYMANAEKPYAVDTLDDADCQWVSVVFMQYCAALTGRRSPVNNGLYELHQLDNGKYRVGPIGYDWSGVN